MPYIDTITAQDATGEVRAMYARQQASWGYVPSYAKVFCHRPEVLARWGRLLAEIRRPMDNRRFELATFAAAHELRNSACSLAHGNALTRFLDMGEVTAIARDGDAPGLTDAERAMMAFARHVARDAATITREEVQGLRDHGFSDPEIFDIAAAAAGRAFFTKMLDSLGAVADAPLGAIDASLRQALTVGHPIHGEAPEVMDLTAQQTG